MVLVPTPTTPLKHRQEHVLPMRLAVCVACLVAFAAMVSFDFATQVYLLRAPQSLARVRSAMLRRVTVTQPRITDLSTSSSSSSSSSGDTAGNGQSVLAVDALSPRFGLPADIAINSVRRCTSVVLSGASCWCAVNASHVDRLDAGAGVSQWNQPRRFDAYLVNVLAAVTTSLATNTDVVCVQHFNGSVALWQCAGSSACALLRSWPITQKILSCALAANASSPSAALVTTATNVLHLTSVGDVVVASAVGPALVASDGACAWMVAQLTRQINVSRVCAGAQSSASPLLSTVMTTNAVISTVTLLAPLSDRAVALFAGGSVAWCTVGRACSALQATGATNMRCCVPDGGASAPRILCMGDTADGSVGIFSVDPTTGATPVSIPALPLLQAGDAADISSSAAGVRFAVGTTLYSTSYLGHWRVAGSLSAGQQARLLMWPTALP